MEDLKMEILELSILLSSTFGMSDNQKNLVTELIVMKMKELSNDS